MVDRLVAYERHGGGVVVIRLDRPDQHNGMSAALCRALAEAVAGAEADPEARCIVVTGAGRMFSAGGDMDDDSFVSTEWNQVFEPARDIVEAIRVSAKPWIAAINGPVAGGALGLALAADIRIASDKARFASAFVAIGLAPEMGASWLLPRLLGHERAMAFLLGGERIGAQEARDIGLVSRVVPHDELMPQAIALAERLAALPPLAVAETKRMVVRAGDRSCIAAMEDEAQVAIRLGASADHREGSAAFLEGRKPNFTGT